MASSSDEAGLLELCRRRIQNFREWKLRKVEGRDQENLHLKKDDLVAAVLVPLFLKNGSIHVVLTLRSKLVPTHKGQVSFPGGKQEDGDTDVVATALREAKEEIGLPPEIVETIAVLHPVVSRAREKPLYVYPVVGFIKSNFEVVMNHGEVEATFDVPLHFFLAKSTHEYVKGTFKGFSYTVHGFVYEPVEKKTGFIPSGGFTIWGLTAGICLRVAIVSLNMLPEFELIQSLNTELKQYLEERNAKISQFKAPNISSGL